MGAFLDKPKTEKTNSRGEGAGLRYGVTAMQGWRVDMEDAHAEKIGITGDVLSDWSYFAVFDGHAGMKVAQYSAQNLLPAILESAEMKEVIKELQSNGRKITDKISDLIRKGMRSGFLKLDEQMREQPEVYGENERSGTTAVCGIITPRHIFVANLGDSRAIMSRGGQFSFSSEDHKPFLPKGIKIQITSSISNFYFLMLR